MVIIMSAHSCQKPHNNTMLPLSHSTSIKATRIDNSNIEGSQVFLKSEMEEGVGAPRTYVHTFKLVVFFITPKVLKVLTKVSEDILFLTQTLVG